MILNVMYPIRFLRNAILENRSIAYLVIRTS